VVITGIKLVWTMEVAMMETVLKWSMHGPNALDRAYFKGFQVVGHIEGETIKVL